MVDVPITQASLAAQQIPSVDVIKTIIQKTTPTPIPSPPTTTEAQITIVSAPDPSLTVVERLFALEKKVESLSKVDHSEAIKQSVQANIINEVKNQLSKFLLKVVSDFATPKIKSIVQELKKILLEKMDKTRSFMSHEKHSDLYNGLLNSIMLDESINDQSGSSPKGKSQSKSSSTYKSVQAEEIVHEAKMETDQPTDVNDMGNVDDQPNPDVAPKKDNSVWFKQDPRPKTSDPNWQKEPSADDPPEQSCFMNW
ncbi:hypothetical protein Tco_0489364 [Tanacetum coccineum]